MPLPCPMEHPPSQQDRSPGRALCISCRNLVTPQPRARGLQSRGTISHWLHLSSGGSRTPVPAVPVVCWHWERRQCHSGGCARLVCADLLACTGCAPTFQGPACGRACFSCRASSCQGREDSGEPMALRNFKLHALAHSGHLHLGSTSTEKKCSGLQSPSQRTCPAPA